MLQLPLGRLITTSHRIAVFSQVLAMHDVMHKELRLDTRGFEELKSSAQEFSDLCAVLGLSTTFEATKRMIGELQSVTVQPDVGALYNPGPPLLRLRKSFEDVVACLTFEGNTTVAMLLPSDKAKLYDPTSPLFGPQVATKFPSLGAEISEGGNVFH